MKLFIIFLIPFLLFSKNLDLNKEFKKGDKINYKELKIEEMLYLCENKTLFKKLFEKKKGKNVEHVNYGQPINWRTKTPYKCSVIEEDLVIYEYLVHSKKVKNITIIIEN